MTEEKLVKAQAVYDAVCNLLSEEKWDFKGDAENLIVTTGAIGEDLPIGIDIFVNAERQLVVLFSRLPIVVGAEKQVEMSVVLSVINSFLAAGSFDFDLKNGCIFFRMTQSFIDSTLGKGALKYMLFGSCKIIDDYNDKLLLLAKGALSFESFLPRTDA